MKRIHKSFPICVFCTLVLMGPNSYAQTEDVPETPRLGWVTIGLGPGGGKEFSGVGAGIAASYYNEAGLFSLRLQGVSQITFEPIQPKVETESIGELSGMYGFSYKRSLVFLAVSAGLGVVWVTQYGPSGEKLSTTVGIPLEFQAFITPLRWWGLGVTVSGNINRKQSYGGAFICFRLGKLN